MNSTTSLLDRAGLEKAKVSKIIRRGLDGADDGELYLEYRQSEMLLFDNGRLKQATYDTSQGFGLRAVKGDAVGYAHATDVSEAALTRAADTVRAVKGGYTGTVADAPARTNRRLYTDEIHLPHQASTRRSSCCRRSMLTRVPRTSASAKCRQASRLPGKSLRSCGPTARSTGIFAPWFASMSPSSSEKVIVRNPAVMVTADAKGISALSTLALGARPSTTLCVRAC